MIFFEGQKVYMNGNYPAVFKDGKNQHVHRLQWVKFNGEIPKGYIVHHKDGNKLNWDIKNLELVSRGEHVRKHKDVVGRHGIKVIARKNEVEIKFNSIEEAAEFCGTYTSSIQRCFKDKQKHANGWTFKRKRGD